MKLSDFMINNNLPRRARAGWPLVVSGEEIAWVPGYRMGENCAIEENTRQIVHLSLKSLDSAKNAQVNHERRELPVRPALISRRRRRSYYTFLY